MPHRDAGLRFALTRSEGLHLSCMLCKLLRYNHPFAHLFGNVSGNVTENLRM